MGCQNSAIVPNDDNNNLKSQDLHPSTEKEESNTSRDNPSSTDEALQQLRDRIEEPGEVSTSYHMMSSSTILPSRMKTEEGFLVRRDPPESSLPESVMPVTELFNLICIGYRVPHISDPAYMLIIDCREISQYSDNHIVTARHYTALDEQRDCHLDTGGCNKFAVIVVYGESTEDAKAQEMYNRITEKDLYVQVVEGGFPEFNSFAPFLCTNKLLQTELERKANIITYPSVILKDALYQGSAVHAENKVVIDNLKITHIVNVTTEVGCPFQESCEYLHLKFADEGGANLFSVFERAADFIADALKQSGNRVMVHCVMGVSRSSSITISFLMKYFSMSLNDAYTFLKDRRSVAAPNTGFTHQLASYEEHLFGEKLTDPDEILFTAGPRVR
ncbi:putative rhodanese domain-containing dual specificity protein phosphatase [Holothuria leucospilota]|uniref:protein-tyrosine-phosphatase n=1 Tax=Holothuria leucospilota TaxID=206669 RepID=A0A9Q0YK73_HOLLE|nr:putative rhodanese domain-containing dual specificity protein phosphatase [Holothuria leucospilota]